MRCLSRRPECSRPGRAADRGRRRRRAPARDARGRARRRRHGLLPRALDDRRGAVRGRRPRRCGAFAAAARRPGSAGSSTSAASAPAASRRTSPRAGGRARAARVRCADDRVPRVDRGRLRQRLVRHAARAGRAAPRDGHAALGASRAQPIAIEDVLDYLLAALDVERARSDVYEIGGANAVTYRELMLEYAGQRGLRRLLVPVPFLSPRSRPSGSRSSRPSTRASAAAWSRACARHGGPRHARARRLRRAPAVGRRGRRSLDPANENAVMKRPETHGSEPLLLFYS